MESPPVVGPWRWRRWARASHVSGKRREQLGAPPGHLPDTTPSPAGAEGPGSARMCEESDLRRCRGGGRGQECRRSATETPSIGTATVRRCRHRAGRVLLRRLAVERSASASSGRRHRSGDRDLALGRRPAADVHLVAAASLGLAGARWPPARLVDVRRARHARVPDRQGDLDREPLDGYRGREHGVVVALARSRQACGAVPGATTPTPRRRAGRACRSGAARPRSVLHPAIPSSPTGCPVPAVHHLEAIDIDHQDAHGAPPARVSAAARCSRRSNARRFGMPVSSLGFRERVHVGGQRPRSRTVRCRRASRISSPIAPTRPVGGRDPEDVSVDEDRDDQHAGRLSPPDGRRLQARPRGFAAAEQEAWPLRARPPAPADPPAA